MGKEHEKFFVAQWGVLIRDGKCLIIRGVGDSEWQLPGGRIDRDELLEKTAEDALRRELFEELNFKEIKVVQLIDAVIGYTIHSKKPICRLIYLIENERDEIKLSEEHEELRWISVDEVEKFTFKSLMKTKPLAEILKKAFSIYNQN